MHLSETSQRDSQCIQAYKFDQYMFSLEIKSMTMALLTLAATGTL